MRYRWDPVYSGGARRNGAAADAHLRADDRERNEVADTLSRHFADGRLDAAEFKERLDRAMGATTRGDLSGLFGDLPRLVDEPVAPPARRSRAVPLLILVMVVMVVTVALGTTMSYVHLPWLLFVVVGVFLWNRAHRRHGNGSRSRGHQATGPGLDHQVIE